MAVLVIRARSPGRSAARLLTVGLLLLPLGFIALAAVGASYGFSMAGGAMLASSAALVLRDATDDSVCAGDRMVLLLLWLALFGWLVSINQTGQQSFGQDILLVPGIAQALIETPWLPDAFLASEPGRAYPPGLPISFSPFTLLLTGPQKLVL
jgi:hypothetical protein